jgi:hypothetical protein
MNDRAPELTRRELFGMTAGVAFLYGFHVPIGVAAAPRTASFAPNAFIRIDEQGVVTLVMPAGK